MERQEINRILELLESNNKDDFELANNILETHKISLSKEDLSSLKTSRYRTFTTVLQNKNFRVEIHYSSGYFWIQDPTRFLTVIHK